MRWTIFFLLLMAMQLRAAALPGFSDKTQLAEQTRWEMTTEGVRLYLNAADDFDLHRPTELILYLLPNGNSIEQTLGKELARGDDWHFGIQQIAAQVRLLRKLDTRENIVLACLEAPGKSWPLYRASHTDNPWRIRNLVSTVASQIPANQLHITLAAHSGGGSFIIGYLNSGEIDPSINRIIFLDANYSYSDELHHGEKLLNWLHRSSTNHLIVFAYDDRNIVLNGKKIVSNTGGTWRASHRMMDRFAEEQPAQTSQAGPFLHYSFLNGQAQFFLHPNPLQKILHTTMIGEMNAFLHAVTLGRSAENKYGVLGGPPAYGELVAKDAAQARDVTEILNLPSRAPNAPTGSAFLKVIDHLATDEREKMVVDQVLAGNVPDFFRTFKSIGPIGAGSSSVDGIDHVGTYYVSTDVLAIGNDQDFFRMPLTPVSAEKIADALGCSLITRKISDDIYAHADIKVAPMPLTVNRESPETFYQSNQIIESQRGGQSSGLLIAGIKKDVVLTNRLHGREGHVAIYGWHKLDGKPIQPLYVGHLETYVDYSHGIRLIGDAMDVDGKMTTVQTVWADPKLCALLSDEGPINPAHYSPTTHPTTRPTTQVTAH